jgi:hypothetical protein
MSVVARHSAKIHRDLQILQKLKVCYPLIGLQSHSYQRITPRVEHPETALGF